MRSCVGWFVEFLYLVLLDFIFDLNFITMFKDDLCFTPLYKLSEMIRQKEISCAELLSTFYNKIIKYNPTINAVTDIFPLDDLLKEAKECKSLMCGINYPKH